MLYNFPMKFDMNYRLELCSTDISTTAWRGTIQEGDQNSRQQQ